jgi:phosphomevalonate kinase
MSRILTSAPGKAVLLGEYAVLDGAPALSLAINRRARVELVPCDHTGGRIEAPQLGIEPVRFELSDDGNIKWHCPDWPVFRRTGAIIEHLVAHARSRFGSFAPFRARIDTAELFSGSVKLGLGSSAAVTVALDAAITAHASGRRARESPEAVLERLLPVYRGTQGGHGSGIDLASSLFGGLLAYRLTGDRPIVQSLEMPSGLGLLFVWTGTAASTPDLVAAWRRWSRDHVEKSGQIAAQMRRTCDRGLQAVEAGDAQEFARVLGDYGRILGTMGDCAGIAVVTGAHRRAMELAEQCGAYCKPCGAGGGDLAVAVATDVSCFTELTAQLAAAGLEPIPLAMNRHGIELTTA